MMWAVDLPVLGLSREFWVHPKYLYPRYSWGPISVHGINLKILNKWTNLSPFGAKSTQVFGKV